MATLCNCVFVYVCICGSHCLSTGEGGIKLRGLTWLHVWSCPIQQGLSIAIDKCVECCEVKVGY
jgi:hypothetical protein